MNNRKRDRDSSISPGVGNTNFTLVHSLSSIVNNRKRDRDSSTTWGTEYQFHNIAFILFYRTIEREIEIPLPPQVLNTNFTIGHSFSSIVNSIKKKNIHVFVHIFIRRTFCLESLTQYTRINKQYIRVEWFWKHFLTLSMYVVTNWCRIPIPNIDNLMLLFNLWQDLRKCWLLP